jgi:hypothetical protein
MKQSVNVYNVLLTEALGRRNYKRLKVKTQRNTTLKL